MPNIIFYHDEPNETLSLILRDAAGNVVNGEGGELIEGVGLRYAASVTQSLTGWYVAQIFDADGDLLYTGSVKVADDGGSYLIDDPQAAIPAVPTTAENAAAVWNSEERTLSGFGFPVTAEVDPEQLQESMRDAMGLEDGSRVAIPEDVRVTIGPTSARTPQDVDETVLRLRVGDRSLYRVEKVEDSGGNTVDLSDRSNLVLLIESQEGSLLESITPTIINAGAGFAFAPDEAVAAIALPPNNHIWALRDTADRGRVICGGPCIVRRFARGDI